jgi:hypothetical protein
MKQQFADRHVTPLRHIILIQEEELSMLLLLKEADTKRRSIHGVPTKGS